MSKILQTWLLRKLNSYLCIGFNRVEKGHPEEAHFALEKHFALPIYAHDNLKPQAVSTCAAVEFRNAQV